MSVPQRVSLITLGVADVAASSAFYERLGWRRSSASVDGDVTFIDTPGGILGLWSATELGATHAIEAVGADAEVRRLTDGGADHVLEAIGLVATTELAIRCVRPGGTVTLVGMIPQADRIPIDGYRFVEDGVRLLGSNYGSAVPARDFPAIAADVVSGTLPLGRLVSDHIPLRGIADALAAMRRRDGARRVVTFQEGSAGV
jgi:S-(hydroxymethyl)glutathione dehydrogenase/alcohol dehydrogenase